MYCSKSYTCMYLYFLREDDLYDLVLIFAGELKAMINVSLSLLETRVLFSSYVVLDISMCIFVHP